MLKHKITLKACACTKRFPENGKGNNTKEYTQVSRANSGFYLIFIYKKDYKEYTHSFVSQSPQNKTKKNTKIT